MGILPKRQPTTERPRVKPLRQEILRRDLILPEDDLARVPHPYREAIGWGFFAQLYRMNFSASGSSTSSNAPRKNMPKMNPSLQKSLVLIYPAP